MRRVGQVRRRDGNERAIVAALRQVGAEVWPISGAGVGDLLVRYRGSLWCLEVKSARGTATAAQQVTQFPVVRSVDEAIRLITAKDETR